MMTATEMAELVHLWSLIDQVTLTEQEDEIRWRWTTDGSYSAKSAYQAQFIGSYNTFDNKVIWSAKVEDKHHFFAWLMVECKILTTDRLAERNWPCNPVCQLCDQESETAEHMTLRCVFAREVWWLVSQWTFGLIKVPAPDTPIAKWWNRSLGGLAKKDKQRTASMLIYTAWHIWKERNGRVFDAAAVLPARVLALIKEDIKLRSLACDGEGILAVD